MALHPTLPYRVVSRTKALRMKKLLTAREIGRRDGRIGAYFPSGFVGRHKDEYERGISDSKRDTVR
jgi:hypothetical protein